MGNVLLAGDRRKRISAAEIKRAITLFQVLDFQLDQTAGMQLFNAVLPLARAHGLSAYDAPASSSRCPKLFPRRSSTDAWEQQRTLPA